MKTVEDLEMSHSQYLNQLLEVWQLIDSRKKVHQIYLMSFADLDYQYFDFIKINDKESELVITKAIEAKTYRVILFN
jgi:hypothetical protein